MKRTAYGLLVLGALTSGAYAQAVGQNAQAQFIDAQETDLGVLTLSQSQNGVSISGTLSGLSEGEHGFHIHQVWECDPATNFESAGGHFTPMGNQHGFDNPDGPHAGDMENQSADNNGEMVIDVTNEMVSLLEGEEGYLFDDDGSALVIHSQADDYQTDPGGNSGDRVACAVIEPSQE